MLRQWRGIFYADTAKHWLSAWPHLGKPNPKDGCVGKAFVVLQHGVASLFIHKTPSLAKVL
jgi:hypothetical protein